jgi:hypothetical protein
MRSALLAALAVVLLMPATAAAQTPFAPLPSTPQTETQAAPTTTTSSSGGGITTLQQTLLILAGVVLVVGIGVAIARDARAHAPVTDRELRRAAEGDTPEHERPRANPRAKAAAKRARQARKKNRPARK